MQTDSGEFPKALLWVVALSMLSGVAFFALDVHGATPAAVDRLSPVALVYDGPGACPEDCASSAAASAAAAGYQARVVGPQILTEASTAEQVSRLFQNVKVWVQPGGKSREAYEAMNPRLRAAIADFVRTGGGYVGFCAGAFLSTAIIGNTGAPGLGLFPGKTWPYESPPARAELQFSIEKVTWEGRERYIYFEGGPYFFDLDPSVEVTATYQDGRVAAARAEVGLGRISVSGPHPEAPAWWSSADHVRDPDGSDRALAVRMIRWAGRWNKASRN